jgi:hypothetical protein
LVRNFLINHLHGGIGFAAPRLGVCSLERTDQRALSVIGFVCFSMLRVCTAATLLVAAVNAAPMQRSTQLFTLSAASSELLSIGATGAHNDSKGPRVVEEAATLDVSLIAAAVIMVVAGASWAANCTYRRCCSDAAVTHDNDKGDASRDTRVPWLDHAKLYALLLVFLGHVGLASGVHATALPTWLLAVRDFAGYHSLHIFYFVSGCTARVDISKHYIATSFLRLYVPVILMHYWSIFVHPMTQWPELLVSALYTLPYDHFLVPLFLLRCLLAPALGVLSARGLLLAITALYLPVGLTLGPSLAAPQPEFYFATDALAVITTQRLEPILERPVALPPGPCSSLSALKTALAYIVPFFLGLLATRHGLITFWCESVQERFWLRLPACALCILLWGLVLSGHSLHSRIYAAWPRPQCPNSSAVGNWDGPAWNGAEFIGTLATCTDVLQLGWDAMHMLLKVLLSILYMMAAVGWLPVTPRGWITTAGTRTLVAYLLTTPRVRGRVPRVDAESAALRPLAAVAQRHGAAFWGLSIPIVAILLALLTSEAVFGAFSPLVEPVWMMGALSAGRLPRGVRERSVSACRWIGAWLPPFLTMTFAISTANLLTTTAMVANEHVDFIHVPKVS